MIDSNDESNSKKVTIKASEENEKIQLMLRYYGLEEKRRKMKKEEDNQRAFYRPLD